MSYKKEKPKGKKKEGKTMCSVEMTRNMIICIV